jgi:hypothetical protein
MLAFIFVASAIVLGYIQGGRINKTVHVELKHSYLVWFALSLQIGTLLIRPVFGDIIATYSIVGHFMAYVLVVTFLLLNWNIRGLPLIAAGLICNLFAIVSIAGSSSVPSIITGNSVNTDIASIAAIFKSKPLWFIGDIFSMPALLGGDTFSVGDLLVGVGLFIGTRQVLFTWSRRRFQVLSRYQPKHLNNANQEELNDIAS